MFSGLKIVDLTRIFSGPFATRHFADLGADVVKIEPIDGDDSRRYPPLVGKWSGYYELLNRNKSSLFLNLKDKNDLKILYSLCKDADVFVENYSPGIKKKLMINYEDIRKYNKNIIYASICGVSSTVYKKYYDVIAQAESGLISLNGENKDMKISTSIVDAFSGMKLAFAISSALYYRQKYNKGQKVNVSMKGVAFDLLEQNLIEASILNKNPEKVGNMDNAIAPFGVFKAKDGNVVIAIGNETLWNKFLSYLISKDNKIDSKLFKDNQSRLNNISKLKIIIENIFVKYERNKIIVILKNIGIPCASVKTMLDVIKDKENYDYKLLQKRTIKNVGTVVLPLGGVTFSENKIFKYKDAPIAPIK